MTSSSFRHFRPPSSFRCWPKVECSRAFRCHCIKHFRLPLEGWVLKTADRQWHSSRGDYLASDLRKKTGEQEVPLKHGGPQSDNCRLIRLDSDRAPVLGDFFVRRSISLCSHRSRVRVVDLRTTDIQILLLTLALGDSRSNCSWVMQPAHFVVDKRPSEQTRCKEGWHSNRPWAV